MHRRSFVAAVPALIPAMAFSQEATPLAARSPVDLLHAYIEEVRNNGNADMLPDLFDDDEAEAEDRYWRHVRAYADMMTRLDAFNYRAPILVGDKWSAMAYTILTEIEGDDQTETASMIAIAVKDGKIRWLREFGDT